MDGHSLRDIYAMLEYANSRDRARDRESWRRSLIETQAVLNTVSKRPKPLDYLAKKVLGDGDSELRESSADIRRKIREAHELAMTRAKEKDDADRISR